MNTATRVYNRGYANKRAAAVNFSLRQFGFGLLLLILLISAFGVIYGKDLNRRLFIQSQALENQAQYYQVQWSKLLLERGALSTQARIQQLAQEKLNMLTPSSRKIIFVQDGWEMLADNE